MLKASLKILAMIAIAGILVSCKCMTEETRIEKKRTVSEEIVVE